MNLDVANTEQNISVINRNKIIITGIKSVDSFDENFISATTFDNTQINIEGTNLEIRDVNLDKGQFIADGTLLGLFYNETIAVKRTFFGLFKK